jgi:negative regulator of flagellin synthesis FlgM
MIDRLDSSSLGQLRKLESGNAGGSKSEDVGASAAGATNNKASPTAETPLMERTRTQVNNSDGIDRQKVDAIKTAISNGEFNIDATKVAEAMVNMETLTGA